MREYLWTDRGIADARRHKVPLDEAEQAVYAPSGMRYERTLGDLLIMIMGMAGTSRVIAVMCERMSRTSLYRILRVRPMTAREVDEWRRRVFNDHPGL